MKYKQKITELTFDKNPKALEQYLQCLPILLCLHCKQSNIGNNNINTN